ncbi:MAG: cation-transporting P-type ATPase [archaeon]
MDPMTLVGKTGADLLEASSTSEDGLDEREISSRLRRFGANEIHLHKRANPLLLFLKELTALFPLLLLGAAALSFFANLRNPGEGYNLIGYALLGVVILNAVVSFIQKYNTECIMRSFLEYIPEQVQVKRGKKKLVINAKFLVPGDIIYFEEGAKLPADTLILYANELLIDESILTGESVPVNKIGFEKVKEQDVRLGLLFSGSTVLKGNGKGVVLGTGAHTEFGRISTLADSVKETATPIQLQLKDFVKKITILALVIGLSFFLIGFFLRNPFWTNLIFAIGIIVANVPEGLLPTVTLALTRATQKMAKRKAIVKDILSVETLGSTTVICTDKTGTLTQNKLTVTDVYLNSQTYDDPENQRDAIRQNPAFQPYVEAISLCNNANYVREHDEYVYVGDPTETALLRFADSMANVANIRQQFSFLDQKTFSSEDKYMNTTHLTAGDRRYTTFKGAAEVILRMCSGIHQDGRVQTIHDEWRETLNKVHESMERKGLRVLGVAYFDKENEGDLVLTSRQQDLVFLGFVGMIDPPRKEVKKAVELCKKAHIRIIPISGDKAETVEAIARQVGIVTDPTVVSGKELEKMSDKQLKKILGSPELIFARTSPEQKLRIVTALQELGEVVAVTGDGVNDAPALKKADIGVSMGRSGTDVAKEASDIILLDDNFATIVAAVEEGRAVYDNIKKFISYILTSNIPEIIPYLAYVLLPIPLPMTVIQILSIDLITDILPALGLGNEPTEDDVMERPPRRKEEKLVSGRTFLRSYGIIGPLEAAFSFTLFFLILFQGGWMWGDPLLGDSLLYRTATGAFLAAVIFSQIGNVFSSRTARMSAFGKFKVRNAVIMSGIVLEVFFIVAITELPWFHRFFSTAPLPGWTWLVLLVLPILIFLVEESRKLLVRKGVGFLSA